MKKVNNTNLKECCESNFYGVVGPNNMRGFITSESYRSNIFVVRTFYCLTIGNGWSACRERGLQTLIEFLLKKESGFNVYRFDDFSELARWAIKE